MNIKRSKSLLSIGKVGTGRQVYVKPGSPRRVDGMSFSLKAELLQQANQPIRINDPKQEILEFKKEKFYYKILGLCREVERNIYGSND